MIKSTAPTRIDLAGGTLDIWPLYLQFGNPPTLNAAIDLYATVELTRRKDRRIVVESKDLNRKEQFSSIDSLPEKHSLSLILKTLAYYRPVAGLNIVTSSQAPPGSGIGGSSALNIALHGALNMFAQKGLNKKQMLEAAKNIETQVISVPAGWQDYFPPLYGGVRSVRPGFDGVDSVALPVDPAELTRRMVLCYTGKPRQSGINNWEVMKRALDGDRAVTGKLNQIAAIARDMERALAGGHMKKVASLFAREWKARKALAPSISTPHMDRLIRGAMKRGAQAAKVCGAGGGGCVAFIVPPGKKESISAELTRLDGRVIDFRFVKSGLRVQKK
ncbi:GHMP kinase [Candidatus Nitromaritima sp. SCGC AAA799-C22]|nr:GHMP kinase [Candidatus Nitromaritima sp. SCGC AAA799-C22]